MRLFPKLPPKIKKQLSIIKPSTFAGARHYPCSVKLKNSHSLENVCFVAQHECPGLWNAFPITGAGKNWVTLNEVASVLESSSRLPAKFANKIYAGGESRMGCFAFTIVFADGSKQPYIAGELVDFISYPSGKGRRDVVDVIQHKGLNDNPIAAPMYYWCVFSNDKTVEAARRGLLRRTGTSWAWDENKRAYTEIPPEG